MNTTLVVLVVTAIVLIAYDIWTVVKKGASTTISWQIYSVSLKYPIIPFAFGLLMGHLFAGMSGTGCS